MSQLIARYSVLSSFKIRVVFRLCLLVFMVLFSTAGFSISLHDFKENKDDLRLLSFSPSIILQSCPDCLLDSDFYILNTSSYLLHTGSKEPSVPIVEGSDENIAFQFSFGNLRNTQAVTGYNNINLEVLRTWDFGSERSRFETNSLKGKVEKLDRLRNVMETSLGFKKAN